MDGGLRSGPVSRLVRTLGPPFERRVVKVAPGSERAFDRSEWLDAIVVVECGEIELVSLHDARAGFAAGDVLYLCGLPLRALRNRGREPVMLSVISRHRR